MQWLFKLSTRRNVIIGGAIFVVTFAIYSLTTCPTVYWEDSAAFSAVNSILGIPHSPGFPIYVLLGRLFSSIPIQNLAFRSNLMSAFWGSLSLVILYFLMLELFGESRFASEAGKQSSSRVREKWISTMGMIGGTLFLGFCSAFWLQTVRAEVYTLNFFFTLSLVFLLIRCFKEKDTGRRFKVLALFLFVLGLSLANHPLLIMALLPAFLIFLVAADFKRLLNLKRMTLLMSFFLFGISLYLFVPIRSHLSPAINWGKPDSLINFLSYLTRSSQSGSIATGSNVPYLNRFWFTLSFPVIQFGLPLFWLGVLGACAMFKQSKRFFVFAFLIFLLNLLTATWATDFSLRNYDLLGYLLPSLAIFAVWFAVGTSWLGENLLKAGRAFLSGRGWQNRHPINVSAVFLCGLVLLLPIFQIGRNLDQCDKRSSGWAYHQAEQILNSVKRDALIVVEDDNSLTTLWYLNYAENKRPDVKIVSGSALVQKTYRDQLQKQYRQVALPKTRLNDDQRISYDLCAVNIDKMPVYCHYHTRDTSFARHLIPAGYLFEYSREPVTLSDSQIRKQKEFLEANLTNKGFDLITREHFGNLLFNLGVFYNHLGISTTSIECFLWALEIDPSNARIYAQLGKAFLRMGQRTRAKGFFQAALELDPYNQDVRRTLENI
jgi:hypothetical protein